MKRLSLLTLLFLLGCARTGPQTIPRDHFDYNTAISDSWYWIDDNDFQSKVTFTFVMILFSLNESGDNSGLPLVTISAG